MSDDGDLIRCVLDGQLDCFRTLVERYERPVFCLIRNLIADRHECEDLAQDTFLAAYRALGSYDSRRSKFSTWLLTIARNKCFNRLKKRRPAVLESIPDNALSHEPDIGREEVSEHLSAELNRLPFEQKVAFVLSEIQGLTYEEISRMEQIKVGTVKSRISRAKAKLRSLVKHPSEQV
jgi:RNA polymerase sigma-70 factor (ECF subfamily)